MKKLNRTILDHKENYPIKVVQFGEGNFLRAFVDFALHTLNQECDMELGVAVVQPIDRGLINMLNDQDGLYTLFTKGFADGEVIEEKRLVTNIVKGINPYAEFQEYIDLAKLPELEFIISNTTEAGIAYVESDTKEMQPPSSFPAKLTVLLHERFKQFNGSADAGLTIIPCELINYNADTLRSIILKYIDQWNLGSDFENWIKDHNSFHNTLVDRIVPGYPKDELDQYESELDYKDNLIVTAEHFFLWVIEGGQALKEKLPFDQTPLDVKIVDDMQPYRTRKVRILNGAHTSMVPFGILYGNETVKETIDDSFTGKFVEDLLFEEVIPTLELDKEELKQFANDVLDRFRNPFIKHMLSSIALNSISKFKVRVLPSLLSYQEMNGELPKRMTFALACLLRFYKGEWKGESLPINDTQEYVDFFSEIWKTNNPETVTQKALQNTEFWDQDLTQIPGLQDAVSDALSLIETEGIQEGFSEFNK